MQKQLRYFAALTLVALLFALMGCSGGSGTTATTTTTTTPTPSATPGTVQLTVGDAPSDRVVSFSISFDSVSLTNSAGQSVQVLSAPTRFEMTSLAGTTTPVATINIPQGTYSSVTITVSSPQVTITDPSTGQTVQKTLPAGPFSVTVALNPPLALGSSASTLNLDLSLANSVAVDSSGNISFNPRFAASHHEPGPGDQEPEEMDRVVGMVSATNGTQFTITSGFNQRTLTFNTNSSTVFVGLSGVSAMTKGMLVGVQSQPQSDGSLLASKVVQIQPPGPTSLSIEGRVLSVTNPLTSFQMVLHGGIGPGMTTSSMSAAVTANVTSTTTYHADSDGLDLTNATLGFTPTFSASTLTPTQAVEVDTTLAMTPTGMMPIVGMPALGAVTATNVELQQQGIVGTIAAINGNQITVTLDPTSAITTLTKATSVVVYKESATQVRTGVTLSVGSTIVARGLMFNDGGTLRLVASGIATP